MEGVMRRVCVHALVRDPAGRLLLIRPGENAPSSTLRLPGGGVREGETPTDSLARIVQEQTGFQVRIVEQVVTDVTDAQVRICFVATVTYGVLRTDMRGGTSHAQWVAPEYVVGTAREPLLDVACAAAGISLDPQKARKEDNVAGRQVLVFCTPEMADWQFAYIPAWLAVARRLGRTSLCDRLVSHSGDSVTTLGGVRVACDAAASDYIPGGPFGARFDRRVAGVVFPGGDGWGGPAAEAALSLARQAVGAGVPVGAMCGAVRALAGKGWLNERDHTCTSREAVQVPGYAGASRYVEKDVVTDGGITTAGGMRAAEFAREFLGRLDVPTPPGG